MKKVGEFPQWCQTKKNPQCEVVEAEMAGKRSENSQDLGHTAEGWRYEYEGISNIRAGSCKYPPAKFQGYVIKHQQLNGARKKSPPGTKPALKTDQGLNLTGLLERAEWAVEESGPTADVCAAPDHAAMREFRDGCQQETWTKSPGFHQGGWFGSFWTRLSD